MKTTPGFIGYDVGPKWDSLQLGPSELAHLMAQDPTLSSCSGSRKAGSKGHTFPWKKKCCINTRGKLRS